MTAAKNTLTRTGLKIIPAIHACRKQIAGLAEEDAWRDYLRRLTGKDSLRAMTGPQLGLVLDDLHRQGARKAPPKRATKRPLSWADSDQARLIRALWLDLWHLGCIADPSEETLGTFVRRQARVEVLKWLRPDQAASVIEALKDWLARDVSKGGGGVVWGLASPQRAVINAQARLLAQLGIDDLAPNHLPSDETEIIILLGGIIRSGLAKRPDVRKGGND